MKIKLLRILSAMIIALTPAMATTIVSSPVFAEGATSCDNNFLGFVSWHNGLDKNSDCTIKSPTAGSDGSGLASFIWKIALNILVDLFTATGYISVFFIVYGGYLFILSDGDPGKMAKGKKTLIAAIVGLLICIFANIIIRTILAVLTTSAGA